MTPAEIKADRAVIDAATSPDWIVCAAISASDDSPEHAEAASAFVAASVTRWPAALNEVERLRKPLTDEQVADIDLQSVYDGNAYTPYRDAWVRMIGIPFARAIEAAKEGM
jgi:hypothetical protein